MLKIITWVDLEGRYRVTSPAYNDPTRSLAETEDEAIERVWAKLVASGRYGIPVDHPRFHVEDADQRTRLAECCGTYFRYGVFMRPNREGRRDADGKIILCRDARDGAWEMDSDGTPKVNMVKARMVQMDYIRVERDKQLKVLDDLQARAVGRADDTERVRLEAEKQILRDLPATFDLSIYATPVTLKAAWPVELPERGV